MEVTLVMFKADGTRRDFPLRKDRIIIGRANTADLRIPLSSVSRQHCEVRVEGGLVKLQDLGSSNGTYQNSTRIQETILSPGDEVIVGPVVFTLVVDGLPKVVEPIRTVLPEPGSHGATAQGSDVHFGSPSGAVNAHKANAAPPLPELEEVPTLDAEPEPAPQLDVEAEAVPTLDTEEIEEPAPAANDIAEVDPAIGLSLDEPEPTPDPTVKHDAKPAAKKSLLDDDIPDLAPAPEDAAHDDDHDALPLVAEEDDEVDAIPIAEEDDEIAPIEEHKPANQKEATSQAQNKPAKK